MENKEGFHYTYSAEQHQEIETIRNSYLPREESKMDTLRALHNSATKKAQVCSITLGIVGALVMGTGMSLAMTDLAQLLGSYSHVAMLIGILIGIVGMVLVALAYPVYNRVLRKQRQRIAPEVLRLTEELLK